MSLADQPGFTILLHGETYPANGTPQIFNLTMLCGSEAKEPSFSNYDTVTATVTWETPAACVKDSPDDPPEPSPDDPAAPSSNGLGWFFFL